VEPSVIRRKPIIDSRIERQIITGMIVSDRFIREIRPLCSPDVFQANFSRRVAQWCLDYQEKYNKSPGKYIEDLYLQHKNEFSEDEAAIMESFLSGISEEYERAEAFNIEYVLDKAEEHFRLSALKNLQDSLHRSVVAGRPEEAEEIVKGYRRPARPKSKGIDPLRDVDSIANALTPEETNPDVIMRLPGDLGVEVGPLERSFFVAVQAESGVGKTWWLWFISHLAVLLGYDTVFFSMDTSALKMIQRIWQTITGAPSAFLPDYMLGEKGGLLIPVFDCEKNQNGKCRKRRILVESFDDEEIDGPEKRKKKERKKYMMPCRIALVEGKENKGIKPAYKEAKGYYPCTRCRGGEDFAVSTWWREISKRERLSPEVALLKHMSLDRSGVLKRAGKFHLVEFPSRRHTMEDLLTYLNNLEYYEGFVPSVIVTDYADKFKWRTPGDPRVSIGEIWDGHKALAQEKHCLVVTASQSNTMRSGKQVGRSSWGETIEKEHLLDLGIAFNQSAQDQASGIMRASIAKKRHGRMERAAEVVVLQQLAIGKPYVDSFRLIKRKEGRKEDEDNA